MSVHFAQCFGGHIQCILQKPRALIVLSLAVENRPFCLSLFFPQSFPGQAQKGGLNCIFRWPWSLNGLECSQVFLFLSNELIIKQTLVQEKGKSERFMLYPCSLNIDKYLSYWEISILGSHHYPVIIGSTHLKNTKYNTLSSVDFG